MSKIAGGHIKVNPFHLDDAASTLSNQVVPAVDAVEQAVLSHVNTSIGAPFDAAFDAAISALLTDASTLSSKISAISPALTSASEAYQGVDVRVVTGGNGHGPRNAI